MTSRTAGRVAWSAWGLIVVLAGLSFVLIGLSETTGDPARFGPQGFDGALSLLFGTVGALIASRRPDNVIGWLFLAMGLVGGIGSAGTEYGTYAYYEGHGSRALGHVGAWLANWVWVILVGPLFTFIPLTFPDGRLRSRCWRPVVALAMAAMAVGAVGFALTPRIEGEFDVGNPFGLEAEQPWVGLSFGAVFLLLAAAVASAVSLILRYREARGEERAQMKWLVYSAAVATVAFAVFGPTGWGPGELLLIGCFFLIPIAIALAILRHRLYDVDLVINKTVVYGALAAFVGLVYVAVVIGVGAAVGATAGERSLGLSILATAIVALAFQPLRQRVQHLVNRLVYGKRATPYEVLSEFAAHVGETFSTEDVLPRTARIVGEGVGAARADVWLRIGGHLRPAATWPGGGEPLEPVPLNGSELAGAELPELPGDVAFPVRHRGEFLGVLTVVKPRGEPVTPTEEKLLRDLASQAGLVLRNARLTEELRAHVEELQASRQRIVAAQDSERRRIERNIHDGAQQELVGLAVRLRLAENTAESDPPKTRRMLVDLQADAAGALETLRDLARGIFPPILADAGLAAALEAQSRRSPIRVRLSVDGVGRYAPEVEAAVYFCVLEALQNAAKYSGASGADVRVWAGDGKLAFTVADDGRGFDPATTPRGMGLQNMADRLAALGGSLEVRSAPGSGTTIEGNIPVGGANR
jgi:signal transduction histidine kinase